MTRIAVFSDVHGNVGAFQAMYVDSQTQRVDEYWFVGDLFMPGPGAQKMWAQVMAMHPTVMVRGNWDDLLVNGARDQLVIDKPSRRFFSVLAHYTAARLTPAILDTIAGWPLATTKKVNGLTVNISHNLPYHNFGQKLYPTAPQDNFDELVPDDQADMAVYAHVHHATLRYTNHEQLVVNPGSVGEPFDAWPRLQRDLRAQYVILTVDEQGRPAVDFRRIDYDHEAEAQRAEKCAVPYADLYREQLFEGRVHTHDQELLARINHERGYDQQAH